MSEPSAVRPFSPVAFLFEPGREFAKLLARPRSGALMLVYLLGLVALQWAYFQRLDIVWFKGYLAATNPAIAHVARGGGALPLTRGLLLVPGMLGASTGIVAGWLVTSAYVRFVASACRRPLDWAQARALAAWAGLPSVIALLPSALNLALHPDGRLSPDQLDPTTLAMLFGRPHDAFLAGVARVVGPFGVWSWCLMALGLRVALRLRGWQAIALVAVPVALLVGGQAAFMAAVGG